jgi:hypothetical protein
MTTSGSLAPTTTAGIELARIRSGQATIEHAHRTGEEEGLTEGIMYPVLSRWKTFTIISTVSGITVLNSMQNGIVTVGLPTIGRDLGLSENLILWYPIPDPQSPPRELSSQATFQDIF